MRATTTEISRPPIDYPDDDGQPMSDNTLQFKWIVVIKEGLETLFRHEPNAFVAGDLLWYPVEGSRRSARPPTPWSRSAAPRAIADPTSNGWKTGGRGAGSYSKCSRRATGLRRWLRKVPDLEKYQVEEYYLRSGYGRAAGLDPERRRPGGSPGDAGPYQPEAGHPLSAGRRAGQPRDPRPGRRAVRDPHQELADRAEMERQRRDGAAAHDAERQRADRLSAKLRELGVEPGITRSRRVLRRQGVLPPMPGLSLSDV